MKPDLNRWTATLVTPGEEDNFDPYYILHGRSNVSLTTREPIKRMKISELFEEFEVPPYNDNGVFRLSLIPTGQVGALYFLSEDPRHVYVTLTNEDNDSTTEIREFAKTQYGIWRA